MVYYNTGLICVALASSCISYDDVLSKVTAEIYKCDNIAQNTPKWLDVS